MGTDIVDENDALTSQFPRLKYYRDESSFHHGKSTSKGTFVIYPDSVVDFGVAGAEVKNKPHCFSVTSYVATKKGDRKKIPVRILLQAANDVEAEQWCMCLQQAANFSIWTEESAKLSHEERVQATVQEEQQHQQQQLNPTFIENVLCPSEDGESSSLPLLDVTVSNARLSLQAQQQHGEFLPAGYYEHIRKCDSSAHTPPIERWSPIGGAGPLHVSTGQCVARVQGLAKPLFHCRGLTLKGTVVAAGLLPVGPEVRVDCVQLSHVSSCAPRAQEDRLRGPPPVSGSSSLHDEGGRRRKSSSEILVSTIQPWVVVTRCSHPTKVYADLAIDIDEGGISVAAAVLPPVMRVVTYMLGLIPAPRPSPGSDLNTQKQPSPWSPPLLPTPRPWWDVVASQLHGTLQLKCDRPVVHAHSSTGDPTDVLVLSTGLFETTMCTKSNVCTVGLSHAGVFSPVCGSDTQPRWDSADLFLSRLVAADRLDAKIGIKWQREIEDHHLSKMEPEATGSDNGGGLWKRKHDLGCFTGTGYAVDVAVTVSTDDDRSSGMDLLKSIGRRGARLNDVEVDPRNSIFLKTDRIRWLQHLCAHFWDPASTAASAAVAAAAEFGTVETSSGTAGDTTHISDTGGVPTQAPPPESTPLSLLSVLSFKLSIAEGHLYLWDNDSWQSALYLTTDDAQLALHGIRATEGDNVGQFQTKLKLSLMDIRGAILERVADDSAAHFKYPSASLKMARHDAAWFSVENPSLRRSKSRNDGIDSAQRVHPFQPCLRQHNALLSTPQLVFTSGGWSPEDDGGGAALETVGGGNDANPGSSFIVHSLRLVYSLDIRNLLVSVSGSVVTLRPIVPPEDAEDGNTSDDNTNDADVTNIDDTSNGADDSSNDAEVSAIRDGHVESRLKDLLRQKSMKRQSSSPCNSPDVRTTRKRRASSASSTGWSSSAGGATPSKDDVDDEEDTYDMNLDYTINFLSPQVNVQDAETKSSLIISAEEVKLEGMSRPYKDSAPVVDSSEPTAFAKEMDFSLAGFQFFVTPMDVDLETGGISWVAQKEQDAAGLKQGIPIIYHLAGAGSHQGNTTSSVDISQSHYEDECSAMQWSDDPDHIRSNHVETAALRALGMSLSGSEEYIGGDPLLTSSLARAVSNVFSLQCVYQFVAPDKHNLKPVSLVLKVPDLSLDFGDGEDFRQFSDVVQNVLAAPPGDSFVIAPEDEDTCTKTGGVSSSAAFQTEELQKSNSSLKMGDMNSSAALMNSSTPSMSSACDLVSMDGVSPAGGGKTPHSSSKASSAALQEILGRLGMRVAHSGQSPLLKKIELSLGSAKVILRSSIPPDANVAPLGLEVGIKSLSGDFLFVKNCERTREQGEREKRKRKESCTHVAASRCMPCRAPKSTAFLPACDLRPPAFVLSKEIDDFVSQPAPPPPHLSFHTSACRDGRIPEGPVREPRVQAGKHVDQISRGLLRGSHARGHGPHAPRPNVTHPI
jgi:hypothetical protein